MKIEIPDKYFNKEELKNTPDRHKRFLDEWLNDSSKFEFTTFKNPGYDEMIIVSNVSFYSMCSHHLVPFFGVAHFAYIPDKIICGLSKIPRVIDKFAHKPQVQEKLTCEILDFLTEELKPHWAMLMVEAEHLCMSMRGIKKPNHKTITNAIFVNPKSTLLLENCKEEFINTIRGR